MQNSMQPSERLQALRIAKSRLSEILLRPETRASAFAAVRRIPTSDPTENVQGVAVGHKVSDGRITSELSVKIFVAKKFPPDQMRSDHLLPATIDGLPTDVEETGYFHRHAVAPAPGAATFDPKGRRRPAQPGSSIGFADPQGKFEMAGTFGAVVHREGTTYVLSNNHVLANENALPLGAAIFQPGLLDGGDTTTDQIARLSQFVELRSDQPNTVDCAIAEVLDGGLVSNELLNGVVPVGPADPEHDMVVEKVGRTTGYTAGRISSIDADVKVGYEIGTLVFTNQILIVGLSGAFSAAGDSGSLIVERDTHRAVGLLFAGSDTHTIANDLSTVLTELGVDLA
jgi:hypothetical protein